MRLPTGLALPARLIPLALVAVLATSACQPVTAGAAAIVANDRLTVGELQHDVDQLVADGGGTGQNSGDLARNTLDRWVYAQLVEQVADQQGVTVSAGDVDRRIAQVKAQAGADGYRTAVINSGVPVEDAPALVRMVVQLDQLGDKLVAEDSTKDPQALAQERQQAVAKAITDQAKKTEIKINPRYGSFDPASASIQRMDSGGLAVDEQTFKQHR